MFMKPTEESKEHLRQLSLKTKHFSLMLKLQLFTEATN